MRTDVRLRIRQLTAAAAVVGCLLAVAACGSGHGDATAATEQTTPTTSSTTTTTTTSTGTTTTPALPGTGKPPVTIGDKNFTEQFVLGELYAQALQAQGFAVQLNKNIGPTQVTVQALLSGRLDMYPEYLGLWDSAIAGYPHPFATERSAYAAARNWAHHRGLELLHPTPFSDTPAIAVQASYAKQHGLRTLTDLRKVASTLTLGAPPPFQQDPSALPALEQTYGFTPASFQSLAFGDQYQALDAGSVQAADVNTTDGQLELGGYTLLRDPAGVLGFGQVVPVVRTSVLQTEGPAFAATIDRVSSLLTLPVMRLLNAAVDIYHQDPASVATQFLQANGVLPTPAP